MDSSTRKTKINMHIALESLNCRFCYLFESHMHRDSITRKTKAPVQNFPSEIFAEICSWLPEKSVGRFTTINKTWYAFINCSKFIATHLKQSLVRNLDGDSSQYLLHVPFYSDEDVKTCKIIRRCANMASFDLAYDLNLPMQIKSKQCNLVGSCNGLVCLSVDKFAHGFRYDQVIYLWNPLIQKFKSIVGTSWGSLSSIGDVGFWYDSVESDYKLIRILYYEVQDDFVGTNSHRKEQSAVEVYSLKKGSWRKIDEKPLGMTDCSSAIHIVVDGSVNWMVKDHQKDGKKTEFIMSFDTGAEKFRAIDLPQLCENHCNRPRLVIYEGCIGIMVASNFASSRWCLWVFKNEKWVDVYHDLDVGSGETSSYALQSIKNNEIIYHNIYGEMIVYDLEKKQGRAIGRPRCNVTPWVSYKESLVLLDKKSTSEKNLSLLE